MGFRADFFEGAVTIAPLLPPAATVAIAVGVAASAAGLSPLHAIVLSVAVYFPSVMLAALDQLAAGLPAAVIVGTSLVVGIRVVILSLSIAPYFTRFSSRWKWGLAYFLWTPVYALTVERFDPEPLADVRGFYLGMAVPLWITVQSFVIVGAVFSARVPPGLELGFIVPLAFIALLMNFIAGPGTKAAAIVGGAVAIVGGALPYGLGLIAATVSGVLAGVVVQQWGRPA